MQKPFWRAGSCALSWLLNDCIAGYMGAAGVTAALIRRAQEGGSYHVKICLTRKAAGLRIATSRSGATGGRISRSPTTNLPTDPSHPLITTKSKQDCHLTLIDVDASGEGTVIFPNKFQQDNLLPAGKEAKFPGSDAPFQFRLKDPGTETVIAICNASGKDVDGIKHDFKTRGFTEVGNYREFLTRQIVVEGQQKAAQGQKAKESGSAAKVEAVATSNTPSRTAIKLEVK